MRAAAPSATPYRLFFVESCSAERPRNLRARQPTTSFPPHQHLHPEEEVEQEKLLEQLQQQPQNTAITRRGE